MSIISEEEAALYDRQLRLWGIETQLRIKNSNILVVGMSPIASEIIKNIILAGVNVLTIADDKDVCEADIASCFIYGRSDIGKNRAISALKMAQSLNKLVKLNSTYDMCPKTLFESYIPDVVILTIEYGLDWFHTWSSFSHELHKNKSNYTQLYCVMTVGTYAFGFSDLGDYKYILDEKYIAKESQQINNTIVNKNLKTLCFPKLNDLDKVMFTSGSQLSVPIKKLPKGLFLLHCLKYLKDDLTEVNIINIWEKVHLLLDVDRTLVTQEDLASCCTPTHVAVYAVIGGIMSKAIIQGVSHKGAPHGNWYFFDGNKCEATILWLPKLNT